MQSIEEHAAAAYELKATGKCNCSQSVVKVFQDKLPVGEDTLMKLTAGTLPVWDAWRAPAALLSAL